MREEFEKWFATLQGGYFKTPPHPCIKDLTWRAWQAALESAQPYKQPVERTAAEIQAIMDNPQAAHEAYIAGGLRGITTKTP